tara:strand:+ start:190 stop:711 length:522 start_codon:yes stop_codon:yes gene_type:complete
MEDIFYPPMSLEDCPTELLHNFLDTWFDEEYIVREWNNMGFFMEREKRLRYKFMQLSEWGKNSFKQDESDVPNDLQFKPLAKYYGDWEALANLTHKKMLDIVEELDLDWLGDDFEDIESYIWEVETYVKGLYLDVKYGGWDDELTMYVRPFSKGDLERMQERYELGKIEYEKV